MRVNVRVWHRPHVEWDWRSGSPSGTVHQWRRGGKIPSVANHASKQPG